jgi:hypothetical protein
MAAAAADGGERGREGLEVVVCCVVWVRGSLSSWAY